MVRIHRGRLLRLAVGTLIAANPIASLKRLPGTRDHQVCRRRALSEYLTASIVVDALEMAIDRRAPPAGLLHHSDRGVQYAAHAFRGLLECRAPGQDRAKATRSVTSRAA